MPLPRESAESANELPGNSRAVARLASLGPEAQGDIDESVLRDNLVLTPVQRLEAMSQAATQLQMLQRAMDTAAHG